MKALKHIFKGNSRGILLGHALLDLGDLFVGEPIDTFVPCIASPVPCVRRAGEAIMPSGPCCARDSCRDDGLPLPALLLRIGIYQRTDHTLVRHAALLRGTLEKGHRAL